MIEDLFIISDGGSLLFSWHGSGEGASQDDLVGGFLSAIDSFVTSERGEQIKVLKLDPSSIIFDKIEKINMKFILSTKRLELLDLLVRVLQDVITRFEELFGEGLKDGFDGSINKFANFGEEIKNIMMSFGLDDLESIEEKIKEEKFLKSIILLDPEEAKILHVHANQYVNLDKISFFIPLILNTIKIMYKDSIKQHKFWLTFNSQDKEILLIEPHDRVVMVKEFSYKGEDFETLSSLDLYKKSDKLINKQKALQKHFDKVNWPDKVDSIYIIDTNGKILVKKEESLSLNADMLPEMVGFFTSSKRACSDIYSKELCYTSIKTGKYSLVLINLNKIILIFTLAEGIVKDIIDIQNICSEIIKKIG